MDIIILCFFRNLYFYPITIPIFFDMPVRKSTLIVTILLMVYSFSPPGASFLSAENRKADSLVRVMQSAVADTTRINAMVELTLADRSKFDTVWIDSIYRMADRIHFVPGLTRSLNLRGGYFLNRGLFNKAAPWFRKSLQVSIAERFKPGIVKAAGNQALVLMRQGEYDSSEKYLLMAIREWDPSLGKGLQMKIQSDLGLLYMNMGRYEDALRTFMPAVLFYEKMKDTLNMQTIYNNLGILYKNINRFQLSYNYFSKVISIRNLQLSSLSLTATAYNNIAILYQDIKGDYPASLPWLEKARIFADSVGDKILYYKVLNNIGNVHYKGYHFDSAIQNYLEVIEKASELMNYQALTGIYINLGSSYVAVGQFEKAGPLLSEWTAKAVQARELKYAQVGYRGLYQIDSIKGNIKSANFNLRQLLWITDTLAGIEMHNRLAEIESDFRIRQQAQDIEVLKKDNELNRVIISRQRILGGGIIILLLVFIMSIIYLFRNTRRLRRLNKEILERERIIEEKNRELLKLVQTKDRLFSVISHDLKSPFNVLLGFSEILANPDEEMDSGERDKITVLLHQTAENTYRLLENLLDWSRAQQGLLTTAPQAVDINEIVLDVMKLLQNLLLVKGIQIENRIGPGVIALTDPKALSGTFLNLINNAVKFTPAKGHITVSSVKADGLITLCVEDDGIGIPTGDLPGLFSLDRQVRRKGTSNEPGTGLGLILCQEYVRLMNGRIWVESIENQGSRFYFTVPALPD